MAEKLSKRQDKFCREFIIDCNATQAAIRAGYSKATATQAASRLLTYVNVQHRIAELQKKVCDKTEVTAEDVLESIKEVRRRCMEIDVVTSKDGEFTGLLKFDASNALKANELLGKHIALFTDKVEHSGSVDVNATAKIIDKYLDE